MLPSHLPEPDLYRPGTGEPSLRWGIAGPGWIAGEFTKALKAHTNQQVVAVSSRAQERGAAFAAEHGLSLTFGSVEQMAAHPEVDVVYIATPPSDHVISGLAVIAAGKHVMIEKPFTVSAAQAHQLADAARAAGVLAMEGMWNRYLPQTSVLRKLLDDGVLGEVRTLLADHGQAIPADPQHRLYRPELGGGALMDIGIYPMAFSSFVLGPPRQVTAIGSMTDTGVDAQSTIVLQHAGGAQSTLFSSIVGRTPSTATVAGSEASLTFGEYFYTPTTFTLRGPGHFDPVLSWSDPSGLTQFEALSWEATALATFVGQGRTESPVHTLSEITQIMDTIDQARAQIAAS
ncbi:Gfo/Idh/MocA family oxidoreductase [Kineosporia sp. NBRC 101731]|uniref:Gfo/Idh/MocA family protein n=1 Tax=Kineosporia sp. NBRC 101731 TaxID=3032199 RepID=UPI0024A327D6|nr:Gfo/Idh/MocA family oxidoreductase [Kineosporia sp. NBRC 101731]GLY31059.1 oxidoreductase [Kineosporia sp. NBRC 101731]